MQGIGFLFPSGDNGDEVASTGLKQVDHPASDPYATAAGGTADAAEFANGEDASDGILYGVRTFNQDSSLAVKKGWDDVTGVGSPNPKRLTAPTG